MVKCSFQITYEVGADEPNSSNKPLNTSWLASHLVWEGSACTTRCSSRPCPSHNTPCSDPRHKIRFLFVMWRWSPHRRSLKTLLWCIRSELASRKFKTYIEGRCSMVSKIHWSGHTWKYFWLVIHLWIFICWAVHKYMKWAWDDTLATWFSANALCRLFYDKMSTLWHEGMTLVRLLLDEAWTLTPPA